VTELNFSKLLAEGMANTQLSPVTSLFLKEDSRDIILPVALSSSVST